MIIEDHELLAHSLRLALSAEGMSVTAGPLEATAVVAMAAECKPDVALLDLDLGSGGDGIELVAPLVRIGVRVIVVSATADRARVAACIERGAWCFHSKSLPLAELLTTVRRAAAGEQVLSEAARHDLMTDLRRARRARDRDLAPYESLTARERFVLAELMDGKSAANIAASSYVSEATIRTQIRAVLTKLGVTSQLAAVAAARRVDWRSDLPAG
jgi:DNA-binding NarL/FixJ family response regulator